MQLVDNFYDSAKDVIVLNMDLNNLSLGGMLGAVFRYFAIIMGVPVQDATTIGGLMGTKLVINDKGRRNARALRSANLVGHEALQNDLIGTITTDISQINEKFFADASGL